VSVLLEAHALKTYFGKHRGALQKEKRTVKKKSERTNIQSWRSLAPNLEKGRGSSYTLEAQGEGRS